MVKKAAAKSPAISRPKPVASKKAASNPQPRPQSARTKKAPTKMVPGSDAKTSAKVKSSKSAPPVRQVSNRPPALPIAAAASSGPIAKVAASNKTPAPPSVPKSSARKASGKASVAASKISSKKSPEKPAAPSTSAKKSPAKLFSPQQPKKLDNVYNSPPRSPSPPAAADQLSDSDENEGSDHNQNDDDVKLQTTFLDANADEVYEGIVTEIPSFSRFKTRWQEIGSLTAQSIATFYEPSTFAADIAADLTDEQGRSMERATAGQLSKLFAHQLSTESQLTTNVRQKWLTLHEKHRGVAETAPPVESPAAAPSSSVTEDQRYWSLKEKISHAPTTILDADTVFGVQAGFMVVPHEEIISQLHQTASNNALLQHSQPSRATAVQWKHLERWDKDSWLSFEKDWWNSVNQAAQIGVWAPIISLIKVRLINDIKSDLKMSKNHWFAVSDIVFLRQAHAFFGPENTKEALALFQPLVCNDYSKQYNPQAFMNLLSTYNDRFLRTIDLEVAPSIGKWPPRTAEKSGPLTLRNLREAFKNGFAGSKDTSTSSKYCYDLCKANPTMSHNALYLEMRANFQGDLRALSRATLKGKHSVNPFSRSNGGGAADHQSKKFFNGGGTSAPANSQRTKRGRDDDGDKPKFRVVLGKDRGALCGDFTNHYGLGCSAGTCFAFNTKLKKPAGYKWKDSDQEDKVHIDDATFAKLKQDHPDINKAIAAARVEHRKPQGDSRKSQKPLFNKQGVTGASKGKYYFDSSEINFDSIDADNLRAIGLGNRFFGAIAIHTGHEMSVGADGPTIFLNFHREVRQGSKKRDDKTIEARLTSNSLVNVIPRNLAEMASSFGKLKNSSSSTAMPDNVRLDGRSAVQLTIEVQLHKHKMSSPVAQWFVIDDNADQSISLCSNFLSDVGLNEAVVRKWHRTRATVENTATCSFRSRSRNELHIKRHGD